MGIMAIEIERAEARGEKVIGSSFTKEVRDVELNNFEVGDVFTIPETFEVRQQKFGGNTTEYIFVDVNGNAKRFYPSVMWKRRQRYTEEKSADGKSIPVPTGEYIHTTGKVAEDFRKFGTVQNAMESLKGKAIKIAGVTPVNTLRYGTTTLTTSNIFQIEYADTKK